jgi:phage shock protein B
MIEELYALARRLDDRVRTVEKIVTADHPNWREIAHDPAPAIDNETSDTLRRIK